MGEGKPADYRLPASQVTIMLFLGVNISRLYRMRTPYMAQLTTTHNTHTDTHMHVAAPDR